MAIEKLSDSSRVISEKIPFLQVLNEVVEHIKDNDAFRLYCYLLSKNRDWAVVKDYAKKICDVGEKKAEKCWAYLARCNLIVNRPLKDEKGIFLKHDLIVLNGLEFKKDEPFINPNKPTPAKTAVVDKTHSCKNPRSGQSTAVENAVLLNKDLTNKDFKQNKDKSFCVSREQKAANEKKHDFATKPVAPTAPVKFWGKGHPDYDRIHGNKK